MTLRANPIRASDGSPIYSYGAGPSKPRAKRGTPEADFQKSLVSALAVALPPQYTFFASMVGTNVGKYKGADLRAMGVRRDFPDLNIINLDTGSWRGLELKSADGSLRPGQRALRDRLNGKMVSAKTLAQAQAALLGWGVKLLMPLSFANRYDLATWERLTAVQKDEAWRA